MQKLWTMCYAHHSECVEANYNRNIPLSIQVSRTPWCLQKLQHWLHTKFSENTIMSFFTETFDRSAIKHHLMWSTAGFLNLWLWLWPTEEFLTHHRLALLKSSTLCNLNLSINNVGTLCNWTFRHNTQSLSSLCVRNYCGMEISTQATRCAQNIVT